MNQILLLMHNNVELTRQCIESLRSQDVPTTIYVVDNATGEDTQWVEENVDNYDRFDPQLGVSAGWNAGLEILFAEGAEHVLVPNTDTILPPWFYRTLLTHNVPFVSGVSVDTMDAIATPPPSHPLRECPDFSAFLIRRECWEKVGPFDERLVHYCSDMDYHIRAHRLGIPLMNAAVPFYHERSSTLKHATPEEQREIQAQADKDRATFRSIYGFGANDPQYEEVFKEKLDGKV